MHSWKPRGPREAAATAGPGAWLLDTHDELAREPRLLTDAILLGAVHAEFVERLGADDACEALRQIGFVLGLRDGLRVVRAGFEGLARGTAPPAAPALSLELDAPLLDDSALPLRGRFPSAFEARARARLLGPSDTVECHLSAGYASGWLSGLLDVDVDAAEERCTARGDDGCTFVAHEACADEERRTDSALSQRPFPFAALRERVEDELDAERQGVGPCVVDPDSPAIHVWGPVMVVPFGGPDDSLRAIDLIGRDPAARDVAVVVIDLTGTVIDDAFGAAALESVLDAIESWGAEPVLAGVCPLSQRIVADLERHHLVVRKDMSSAVASAFQIAEAQRRFA